MPWRWHGAAERQPLVAGGGTPDTGQMACKYSCMRLIELFSSCPSITATFAGVFRVFLSLASAPASDSAQTQHSE